MAIEKILRQINKNVRSKNHKQIRASNIPSFNEVYGNRSEIISVIVNFLLACSTVAAICISYKSNQTSQAALRHIIEKDSLDKITNSAKSKKDSTDMVITQEQIKTQSSTAKTGLYIAKINSELAMKAVNENEKNADFYKKSVMAQSRAYIMINTVTLVPLPDNNFQVNISVKNLGKTPAYEIQASKIIFIKNNEEFYGDTLWISQKYYLSNSSVLGPDKEQQLLNPQTLRINGEDALLDNNTTFLYVLLRMHYFDIYGNQHRTRMYAVYNTKFKTFINCKKYNDFN